jgi:hypothetical protein
MPIPTDNAPQLYLSLLAYRLIPPELDTLIARIRLGRHDADLLHEVGVLRDGLDALQVEDVRPSQVVHLLGPSSGPAILVAWVASDSEGVRAHLVCYWQEYRHVKPTTTGDDLRAMGLPPSPQYARILDALRDARLDGRITSEADERRLMEEMIGTTEPFSQEG